MSASQLAHRVPIRPLIANIHRVASVDDVGAAPMGGLAVDRDAGGLPARGWCRDDAVWAGRHFDLGATVWAREFIHVGTVPHAYRGAVSYTHLRAHETR